MSIATWRRSVTVPVSALVVMVLVLIGCGPDATDDSSRTPPDTDAAVPTNLRRGASLSKACLMCHSTDGSPKVGPTWLGLAGSQRPLEDGTTVTADGQYLARSIRDPQAQIVKGFTPVMQPYTELSDAEIQDIIAYLESLDE